MGCLEEELEPPGLWPFLFVVSRSRNSDVMVNLYIYGEWSRSIPWLSWNVCVVVAVLVGLREYRIVVVLCGNKDLPCCYI